MDKRESNNVECVNLDTPLPIEEMYGFVVRIKYRNEYWYCFSETIIPAEAKIKARIKFIKEQGRNIYIQQIQCKQILWSEYINPEPQYTWEHYKNKCIL